MNGEFLLSGGFPPGVAIGDNGEVPGFLMPLPYPWFPFLLSQLRATFLLF